MRPVHVPAVDGPRDRLISAVCEFCEAVSKVKHTVGHYGFDEGQMALLLQADDKLTQVFIEDAFEPADDHTIDVGYVHVRVSDCGPARCADNCPHPDHAPESAASVHIDPTPSEPSQFGTPEVGYAMPAGGSTTWPESGA